MGADPIDREPAICLAKLLEFPSRCSSAHRVMEWVSFYKGVVLFAEPCAALQFCGEQPPAQLVFTASDGMRFSPGGQTQQVAQGALLCQDWSRFGRVSADDYLAASDIPDDANVGGLVAFSFACFAAGTPKMDQFF